MKAKITEIFSSIQGEGKYTGINQVFVRFYACNMKCSWCDTPFSAWGISKKFPHSDELIEEVKQIKEYSADELAEEIQKAWSHCHSVSLTGGEPLVQTDFIMELLPFLKKLDYPVYLETNGVLYNELKSIINDIDFIAMDIKLPSSTGCKAYWKEHEKFLKLAAQKDVCIKTVISSQTEKEDIIRATDLTASINPDIFFTIQPNTFDLQNGIMDKCLDYRDYCQEHLKNVRIMPQTHKMMSIK